MRLRIRTRLSLIFAALMLVVVAGAAAFLYMGLASQLDRAIDEGLRSRAEVLATDLADGGILPGEDMGFSASERFFGQVLTPSGAIVTSTPTVQGPLVQPSEIRGLSEPRYLDRAHVASGADGDRARLYLMIAGDLVAVVGTSVRQRDVALDGLGALLWIGGPLVLLAAIALGWLLSGAALRPVERMRRETAAITEGDLQTRLQVPPTGDEIADLATTLNAMLARLERAFEKERRFVDDASHELRTPLSILRAELELALRRARSTEELEAALRSAAEESDRLGRLAEDLLVLARSDRGMLPLTKTSVDAAALVHSAIEPFEARAAARRIHIDVSVPPDLRIDVDELRIQQAVANLVSNALAQTPEGGRITVEVSMDEAGALVLSVGDTGGGFPEGFIDRAFDAFTRADTGRSRRSGGTGLGLAIVKGVAEAHGGKATARNLSGGGAEVRLVLPGAAQPMRGEA